MQNSSNTPYTRARDDKGHFVPLACPDPDCDGTLQYEGDGIWRCDGLIDPNDENKPLAACEFTHIQGRAYP